MCLRTYLPEHHVHIVQANCVEHPERFRTCLQHIFNMLIYRKDKKRLLDYIQRNRKLLEKMDTVEAQAAFVLLGEQKRIEALMRRKEESEEWDVCQAIDELIKDGEKRGRSEGRREGKREGKREGRKEGENRVLALVKALTLDQKQGLIVQVAEDAVLRENLYRQYGL